MITLIILSIVSIVVGVTAFVFASKLGEWSDWSLPLVIVGIIGVFGAIILGAAAATVAEDNYNEETNRICATRGGIVTKDNHCFKDNKPIEFSPGVWRR